MRIAHGRKGQHVIEYILLVVAVILVMIVLHAKNGKYQKSVEDGIFNGALQLIKNVDAEVH